MEEKKIYNVAVYLRLSRDDNKIESDSIISQRDIILSYIRSHEDMKMSDIYIDDGWSGTNFDRPAFKRMLEDIKTGKINCVIVKDLSRLGRDYIEAGRLIQKTFPAFSVRFIALTDNYDSLTADYSERAIILPVKNFVNDSYCRDISCKVRSHQKIKRENGEFIGAFAVYGYKRSKENKNKLVPDSYAADIVKKIFHLKIQGYSCLAIAKKLNGMGILSPLEYKKSQGQNYHTGFITGTNAKWSSAAVKRILENEVYIGNMVQGKSEKVNYKVKKSVMKPKEEWVKVENIHEAIISKEDFETAGRLLKMDIHASSGIGKSHIYSGLLFCGDCMAPMIRRISRYKGKENVYYICAAKNRGEGCTRHSINENKLNNIVLTAIRQQIDLYMDKKNVLSVIGQTEVDFEEVAAFEREIKNMHAEQEKYIYLKAGLYEDMKNHIITEEDFYNFGRVYEQRLKEFGMAIKAQEETVKNLYKSGLESGIELDKIKETMQITEPDRMALITFINRILVYEDKRVYIEFRYNGRKDIKNGYLFGRNLCKIIS